MDEIIPVVWTLLFLEQITCDTCAFYCENAAVSITNWTRTLVIDILYSDAESWLSFPLTKLSSSAKNAFEDQGISPKNFGAPLTITRTFPNIAEDFRKLTKITWSSPKTFVHFWMFNFSWCFTNIFGNELECQTHCSLRKETLKRVWHIVI